MLVSLCQQEPSLAELLQEPMVRQLMRRDRVSADDMQQTLSRAGFRPEEMTDFLDDALALAG